MKAQNRALLLGASLAAGSVQAASITDLSQWTLVEDPPNSHFSAGNGTDQISLSATGGPISSGTDIGYQSVDGDTVTASTSGFYFSPAESFGIAIDFQLSFSGASGTLGIGFGIGEDSDGTDSAGVAMLTSNGNPFGTFSAAGRVDDGNLAPGLIGVSAALQGSLFAFYDAPSGDISLGASQSLNALSPTAIATYTGLQDSWDDDGLLVSMFLRSQTLSLPSPLPDLVEWQSGDANALFSNLRLLSGTPIGIGASATPPERGLPVPPSLALIATGLLALRLSLKTRQGRVSVALS